MATPPPIETLSAGIRDEATSRAVRSLETFCRQAVSQERLTVTGSKGGNAALKSLIAALAQLGLIQDLTT